MTRKMSSCRPTPSGASPTPCGTTPAWGIPPWRGRYLSDLVTSAKNGTMGNYDLSALVSLDEEDIKIDEIEAAMLQEVQMSQRFWNSTASRSMSCG